MALGTLASTRNRKVITTFGPECLPGAISTNTSNIGGAASGTWGTANRAVFIPLAVNEPFTIAKVGVHNGSSVTGNIDVGIYSENGARIWSSGSTAQSGANVMQVFTPGTQIKLAPGRYYVAMACSSGSATITGRLAVQDIGRYIGCGIQASAFPLPSSATIAAAAAALRIPNIWISERATI